jgi:hypothetical protein
MRAVYVLIQYYPAFAIPAAFAFLQLAFHFKRQRRHQSMLINMGFALCMLSSAAGWVIFRGDLHSTRWAKNVVETFSFSQHD